MQFELTINRVGAFGGTTPGGRAVCVEKLERLFRTQLEYLFHKSNDYRTARRSILTRAPGYRPLQDGSDEEGGTIRIKQIPSPDTQGETLLGALPTAKFECTATSQGPGQSRDWIIRARPSIRMDAARDGARSMQFWYKFEGVPANTDPDDRPGGDDISALIALTDSMADAAMGPLHSAYRQALLETGIDARRFKLAENRTRVRMSDSNTYDIEALLDAFHYLRRDVSEIRRRPQFAHARAGLGALEKFVYDVTGRNVPLADGRLKMDDGRFDGLRGIFVRTKVRGGDIMVTGFGHMSASVSGLGTGVVAPEKRRGSKREDHLRGISAARPISGVLAMQEMALAGASL